MAAILGFIEPEIAPFDLPSPKTPQNQTWSGSDDPLWRYGHSKFDISRLTRLCISDLHLGGRGCRKRDGR